MLFREEEAADDDDEHDTYDRDADNHDPSHEGASGKRSRAGSGARSGRTLLSLCTPRRVGSLREQLEAVQRRLAIACMQLIEHVFNDSWDRGRSWRAERGHPRR